MCRTVAGRLIGNAVPPLVMRTVGRWIISAGFGSGNDMNTNSAIPSRSDVRQDDPEGSGTHATVRVHKYIPKCVDEEIEISTHAIMTLTRGTQ